MRLALGRGLLLAGLAGAVVAAHAPAETPSESYRNAMKDLATVVELLPRSLDANDVQALDSLVIKARPAVAVIEMYWSARATEDALTFAQTASKAIAEISVAVHLLSAGPNPIATEGAQEALTNLLAACAACHRAHRETLPDGSFAIK